MKWNRLGIRSAIVIVVIFSIATLAPGGSSPRLWFITGNSGTDPSTNFIGTTDEQPLIVRTNDTKVARFKADGNVALDNSLHVAGDIEIGGTVDGEDVSNLGSQLGSHLSADLDTDPTNELIASASLDGANLSITDAGGTTSVDLSSLAGGFSAGKYSYICGGCLLTFIDLSNADISNGWFGRADFQLGDLTNATVTDTYLKGAKLTSTKLSGANFSRSNLFSAWLINSTSVGTDFSDADLDSARLHEAVLTNANFTNANLDNAIIVRAELTGIVWSNTTCPDGSNSDDSDGDGNTCLSNLDRN